MRLLQLVPGTGRFVCGSCLRDLALARALRAAGHDVTVAPLYLPLVSEQPEAGEPVRMGGINVYLQQRWRGFGRLPRPLARLLDHPRLLRWAAARGGMTDPADLGALTLSMLRGEHGNQAVELDRLVAWLRTVPRPDAVLLSNALLCGVAGRLRQELGLPVVVTLQGEAPFLDALPAEFAEQAWAELRRRAAGADAFVGVSRWYGELMADRLGLDRGRLHVVRNGLDLSDVAAAAPPLAQRRPVVLGYLARMCEDKGLPLLVAAFALLRRRGVVPDLRLAVAGALLAEDRPLVESLRAELRAAGSGAAVEFLPNPARADKVAFLHRLSVLSVPATYGESFGLYVLEALAAGVPVVQPRHGAFPELLEATGGGVLCEPDDPIALADAIEALLADPDRAVALAERGRRVVLAKFTAARMAAEFAAVCSAVIAGGGAN